MLRGDFAPSTICFLSWFSRPLNSWNGNSVFQSNASSSCFMNSRFPTLYSLGSIVRSSQWSIRLFSLHFYLNLAVGCITKMRLHASSSLKFIIAMKDLCKQIYILKLFPTSFVLKSIQRFCLVQTLAVQDYNVQNQQMKN